MRLKRFVNWLKFRLEYLHSSTTHCHNLVLRKEHPWGDTIGMYRCGGFLSEKYGCPDCNPTGFQCPGCGDDVGTSGEFCNQYCWKDWQADREALLYDRY